MNWLRGGGMARRLAVARWPQALLALYLFGTIVVLRPAWAAESSGQVIQRLPARQYLPSEAVDKLSASERLRSPIVRDLSLVLGEAAQKPFSAGASIEATEVQAATFIGEHSTELGLEANAADTRVTSVTRTLSGQHVDVEQRFNGLPIIDAHITINVSGDGSVQSVTRNVVQIPHQKAGSVAKQPAFDEERAKALAWDDLKVSGKLMEEPSIKRAYLNENNALTLVYMVRLAVTQPFGYWEYTLDAKTGRIISKKDRAINERKRATEDAKPSAVSPRHLSLEEAMKELPKASLSKAAVSQTGGADAVAYALVFVPNPVTRLRDETLRDTSPASAFEQAYERVELRHLMHDGALITLSGSNARIEDVEPGEGGLQRAPSTVASEWSARRGDNAFNDVMSYYYIDSSLEYLRRIGYVGSKELFPRGIVVDSDGLGGEDNSHYVPSTDLIAYGHGGIDDNEDSDVILHELGHAITFHINPRWGGGDSGAIGEGFGDYWAASQRMRMKDGWLVMPGRLFLWDGNGETWSGRRDDRTGVSYDPLHVYDAHESIPTNGGYYADELWSTPISLSLIDLIAAGEPPESVDIVVLEGMAEIGRDFTMRSLALKTVEVAGTLYPPPHRHAEIFEKHFRELKLIQ